MYRVGSKWLEARILVKIKLGEGLRFLNVLFKEFYFLLGLPQPYSGPLHVFFLLWDVVFSIHLSTRFPGWSPAGIWFFSVISSCLDPLVFYREWGEQIGCLRSPFTRRSPLKQPWSITLAILNSKLWPVSGMYINISEVIPHLHQKLSTKFWNVIKPEGIHKLLSFNIPRI